MDWFYDVFGFTEQGMGSIQRNITKDGMFLTCHAKGDTRVQCGRLEVPTLQKLREDAKEFLHKNPAKTKTTLREVVGNVQHFHTDPQNKNAIFQVASQCNLLEMVGPSVTPEEGITGYYYDRTQGPACAIACAAGTLERNYLVELAKSDGSVQIGQTENLQVDTLLDVGKLWNNQNDSLWTMRNGYALASLEGLQHITQTLTSANAQQYEEMMGQLRIGMHWDTEVTLEHDHHEKLLVSQAYCSAMPVAYSRQSSNDWETFARFVLEGAYEATMLAGVLNVQRDADTGSNKIFLTLLGGGAFGNRTSWIMDAILRSLRLVENAGLDVYIVSYGHSKPEVQDLISCYEASLD